MSEGFSLRSAAPRRGAEPLAPAGAEILDDDIARERQPSHDIDPRGGLHVDHD